MRTESADKHGVMNDPAPCLFCRPFTSFAVRETFADKEKEGSSNKTRKDKSSKKSSSSKSSSKDKKKRSRG